MNLKLIFIGSSFLSLACSNNGKIKSISNNFFYEKGYCIEDSIFHGIVNRYDHNDNYLGFATYRYGMKNGIYINKYENGVTKDSVIFKSDQKNGFSFSFDTSGKISYKVNFINDRPVGDSYFYDSKGRVKEYGFRDFEGSFIYYLEFVNNEPFSSGKLINYKLDTINTDGHGNKLHVFAYLIRPPDLKIHYKIGKVHEQQILSSEEISDHDIYFESLLDLLPEDQSYALIVSIFNAAKGKHDIEVYMLQ